MSGSKCPSSRSPANLPPVLNVPSSQLLCELLSLDSSLVSDELYRSAIKIRSESFLFRYGSTGFPAFVHAICTRVG